MIVSWNWLKDYVPLDMPADELTRRLAMAGLNHEQSQAVGDDLAIDLEVTSNRPDWMSHVGIAREIAVLYQVPLTLPDPRPLESATDVNALTRVEVECPDLCPKYTARVIRGVRVGPSPSWLVNRLAAVGLKSVNNVVDITNYVLLECGQPLHAFDLAKLREQRIIVREARQGEQIVAIDHKTYSLQPGMCVIADAQRAVAVGGIMGGFDTEVSETTRDLLIEAAEFAPLAIRNAARHLKLRSPSSDRFERGVDPEGVDWASRRCCALILELAGGELCRGAIEVATPRPERPPITLRLSQLPRVLGITVPVAEVRRILSALGCRETAQSSSTVTCHPPSWRRDLSREIDLVEEVARIHGYDRIPESVGVPMAASHRSDTERTVSKTRTALIAAGFHEALTVSAISETWSKAFSPWTDAEPLRSQTPLIKGTDCLRRSLIPSLLAVRASNEAMGNEDIELFEMAKIYLPRPGELPEEPVVLGVTSGRPFHDVKGFLEGWLDAFHIAAPLTVTDMRHPFFLEGTGCQLHLNGDLLGFMGVTSASANKLMGLRQSSTIGEWRLDVVRRHAILVPRYTPLVTFPAIEQDLNFILPERVRWAELEGVVRGAAGELLEEVAYRETYRDTQADGPNTKRILISIRLRSTTGTLTGEQAGDIRTRIVQQVSQQLEGRLLG